jgi:hypothetical protein
MYLVQRKDFLLVDRVHVPCPAEGLTDKVHLPHWKESLPLDEVHVPHPLEGNPFGG